MTSSSLIDVVVASVRRETADVAVFELRSADGGTLPAFSAGAHIDVHLPNGMVRAYSLCNPQSERDRYVIGVANSRNGRGGSSYMHAGLAVGDELSISSPRNNFPLNEEAEHTVLIAGGIGITPILCMAERLESLGRSWELVYCARTRAQAAFIEQLSGDAFAKKVRFVFDGEPGAQMLDIRSLVETMPESTHLYCCGPQPMLDAFEAATAGRPEGTVHLEYFSAKEAPANEGGFTVRLARSQKEFRVKQGETILDALLEMKVPVSYSCLEGTCGECLTPVLCGTPDHRDVYLSKDEHDANDQMTICCSGSKSPLLVLDL
ncbi:PDR/VanB family oxidoreductase [Burkholderia pseudomultivorans]|uniref:PDR/VanB family oxidoreductase n=1 Tax=Burkholderia pseudomultivorans TaxID=1207504 RepID=UPI002875BF78|nr:PDR/VanB family oxidoreductase [Burkholderia pseudomultivorans]MDS0859644.1 PDR/VanB family oxidoreductase [Burkholderia pseudomultivorans]